MDTEEDTATAMENPCYLWEDSMPCLDTVKRGQTQPVELQLPTLKSNHDIGFSLHNILYFRGGPRESGMMGGRQDNWKPPKHLKKHKCVDKEILMNK